MEVQDFLILFQLKSAHNPIHQDSSIQNAYYAFLVYNFYINKLSWS